MLFDGDIETTVVATAVVAWFAHGWYLNQRLRSVHEKLDLVLEQFNGLRQYLYENDPQFDDERYLLGQLFSEEGSMFSGMEHIEIIKKKENEGKRTLNTPFSG